MEHFRLMWKKELCTAVLLTFHGCTDFTLKSLVLQGVFTTIVNLLVVQEIYQTSIMFVMSCYIIHNEVGGKKKKNTFKIFQPICQLC